ncbi:MAG: divergent polysaccharide deacetylase family protein [Gammaproteobacteria bacterium]|nr:divergent polysaccharide deacetylase family protein [Gammaproteobacteria bacterium]
MKPAAFIAGLLLLLPPVCLPGGAAAGEEVSRHPPAVSIIIDDLGYRPASGARVVALPGAITCAFLPNTPHARHLATLAHEAGKEVMLHLPMQAVGRPLMDDGGLLATMTRREFLRVVRRDLLAVPYVSGINNHMGSLLTQSRGHMEWLMEELSQYSGLYFVDSFTSVQSIAHRVAAENRVPTVRRDIFLDAVQDDDAIAREFDGLIETARKHGTAVAIGHPHPQTLAFLEANLGRLREAGIELLPVSQLIRYRRLLDDEARTVVASKTWSPAADAGYPAPRISDAN